jgi:AraC-like DNA-binding protein
LGTVALRDPAADSRAVKRSAMRPREPEAFAFVRDFRRLEAEEREFAYHYLLYVTRGAIRLRVGARTWVLPPQRGAWIDAGTRIAVSSDAPFTTCSVLFSPARFAALRERCRVFAMPPLARHLAVHASQWGRDHTRDAPGKRATFELLAEVCRGSAQERDAFWLPAPPTPSLRHLLDAVLADPAQAPSLAEAAARSGMSERSLSRALARECGMTWREIVHRARMTRATELLVHPRRKIAVVAQDVGFSGQAAFVAAFRKFAGESPSAFRARLGPAPGGSG